MRQLRILHLCCALASLPFVLAYALSGIAIAHRSWFPAGALVRLHTHVPPALGAPLIALVSSALLGLGVTGFLLWLRSHKDRRAGLVVLILGGGVAAALILAMRMG